MDYSTHIGAHGYLLPAENFPLQRPHLRLAPRIPNPVMPCADKETIQDQQQQRAARALNNKEQL